MQRMLIGCANSFLGEDKRLKEVKYSMSPELFDQYLRKYARQFNYTLNEEAAINALSFMYMPWSDQNNQSLLIRGYVDVSGFISWFSTSLGPLLPSVHETLCLHIIITGHTEFQNNKYSFYAVTCWHCYPKAASLVSYVFLRYSMWQYRFYRQCI